MPFWSDVQSQGSYAGYPTDISTEENRLGFREVSFTPLSHETYNAPAGRGVILDVGAQAVAVKAELFGQVRYAFLDRESQEPVDLQTVSPPQNEIGPVSRPDVALHALQELAAGRKIIKTTPLTQ